MGKKALQSQSGIIPRCEYCRNNEGENKQFGHMWHCKVLGYCVPFNYGVIVAGSEERSYCEAIRKGKQGFIVDEVKYKEYLKSINVSKIHP